MRREFFAITVATLAFGLGAFAQSTDKLKVSVYYETLCGDSKRFITKQLYPLKQSPLGEHFAVEFIPYGKATTTPTSDSFIFSCQHGSAECNGNKMHACALKYVNSTQTQLEFIHCSMSTRSPPSSLTECGTKLEIETEEISTCAEGSEGSKLLARNGERTHALVPKLYFVPWITYNGEFTEENLQNSQDNFKTVVCSELKKTGNFACNGGIGISTSNSNPVSATRLLFLVVVFQFTQNKILSRIV